MTGALALLAWTLAGIPAMLAAIIYAPAAPLWAEMDRMPLVWRPLVVLTIAIAWPSMLALLAAEDPSSGRHR